MEIKMRSRKTRVWVVIAFIIIVAATVTIVLRYVNNQRVQRQNQIIMRYDRFNLSAYLKGDVADVNYNWQYHPYSEIDETKLSIALHVYNHYCDRNLCLNDFETFMAQEFRENGEPAILYIPMEIEEYIDWRFDVGNALIDDYLSRLNSYYCSVNNNDTYNEDIYSLNVSEIEGIMRRYDSLNNDLSR